MKQFKELIKFISAHQKASSFPGAAFSIISQDQILFRSSIGRFSPAVNSPNITTETIFDLASLTKPIATTTAILQLWEKKFLSLEDPIHKYLPKFQNYSRKPITIFHLLTHSSGIPSWYPLYLEAQGFQSMIDVIARLHPVSEPGASVNYSCLGYFLLTAIIQQITNQTLYEYTKTSIFEPLNMKNTFFNPPGKLKFAIAPTEFGNEYEKKLVGFRASSFPYWRNYRIQGEVHDCNCYYAGGESGNSGLFSNITDLEKFVRCILNHGSIDGEKLLEKNTIETAFSNYTKGLNSARGLGWLAAISTKSTGQKMPRLAFGHNGFTGTSLWIDPLNKIGIVFLSNRVYFTRSPDDHESFWSFRAGFHDLIYKILG